MAICKKIKKQYSRRRQIGKRLPQFGEKELTVTLTLTTTRS